MNASRESGQSDVWDQIDRDKRSNRTLRRVVIIAWTTVLLTLLVYAGLILFDVARAWQLWSRGAMSSSDVIRFLLPLVYVIGLVSLLIATLSTIGALIRSRTATLGEIQLRLAALESILRARPDSDASR